MSSKDDLELARALQAEYDRETAQGLDENDGDVLFDPASFQSPPGNRQLHVSGNEAMSIVDQRWELLDPSPDVRAMFMEFNERYFWSRLAGVEVRWSPRMTLCAGLCCYEGRGGLCSIRLSTPLLKLRPRKDLVETLLHEMIHAYLFVTDNNKDHDGHGPEFCKHMKRLNSSTGTNITIYHTFHDEVDNYRQHWWKCNGPCQKKQPYFGMVKRAMNRAPSKNDTWWADHQRTCGGTYTKIKEPEGYGEKKKGSKRKKEDGENDSGNEKGAKRPATNGEMFPGKGKAIGAGMSSKPTLLQLWIADQKEKQKDGSITEHKTKPPASLGAPPSSGQSSSSSQNPNSPKKPSQSKSPKKPSQSNTNATDSSKQTPLQKWISKNSDDIKKAVSKSPPSSSSTPATSRVNGGVKKDKKRTNINANPHVNPHIVKKYGKDAPSMKDRHQRKGSGKRQELLAIFDSDSDSDDELFKVPPRKKPNSAGANLSSSFISDSPASGINNQDSLSVGGSKRTPLSDKSPLGESRIVQIPGGIDASKTSSSRHLHRSPPKSTFPNPFLGSGQTSTSSTPIHSNTLPSFDSYVRPKPIFSGSKVTSPSNQSIPGNNSIESGANGGIRPVSGNTSFPASGASQSAGSNNTGTGAQPNFSTGPVGSVVTKTVQCPVCTMSVSELDINAHLDMCLS